MLLPTNGFTFKKFFVAHNRCAMKVNTDAIILGAWANLSQARRIADIGTGSGVIALMAAQRTLPSAFIDAIELDFDAFNQAKCNFANSPWFGRITPVNQDVIEYAELTPKRYDVIVSNPPYFNNSLACPLPARSKARHTETLSHFQLLTACRKLLEPEGVVYLVLPYVTALKFLQRAESIGWFCGRKLAVKDSELKPAHLLLCELALYPLQSIEEVLTIRKRDRQYSDDFRRLTKEFYLFF